VSDTFEHAAVVGATAWGATLAIHLARNGLPVTLVARDAEEAHGLEAARVHERRLPGVAFPDSLRVSCGPDAVAGAGLVCFAVPSQTLAANAKVVAPGVSTDAVLLSATKGIDIATGQRMSEVLSAAIPGRPIAVLSGPNLSREVASGLPGTTVIATRDGHAEALRNAFHSTALRVYTTDDLVGVEFGGALKNVIAIAAGIADAFGFGDNAKAAIITRGLAEMTRLGVAAGANPLTFQGLAGIGDAIATCYSPLSRNRRLGELIGRGATLDEALEELGETAEGARTIPAALLVAGRLGVEMPITAGLEQVLYHGVKPLDAISNLLEREPRSEL
jgi:glycerol-3-phosphate dehydrogenase (NAD(P)+)